MAPALSLLGMHSVRHLMDSARREVRSFRRGSPSVMGVPRVAQARSGPVERELLDDDKRCSTGRRKGEPNVHCFVTRVQTPSQPKGCGAAVIETAGIRLSAW